MSYILKIDVAHPPQKPDQVEEILLRETMFIRNHPHLRVIKVVHGYGSSGGKSHTQETVRNWLYHNRKRFKAIINGEDYGIFNPETQKLRKVCGQIDDTDLDARNPGVTIVWVI